jgi:NADH-quinone oxidoreductase subunit L
MAGSFALAVILIPWLGALAVWWAGDERPLAQHMLAIVFSLVTTVVSLMLIPLIRVGDVLILPAGQFFGDFTFMVDGLGVFLAIIAAGIGALAVIFSVNYMEGEAQLGRYYSLLLLFVGAMIGLVLTGSLLLLFFFWEITAFCSYALISFHNDDPKAVAGGIKALIVTQVGGIGLLAGALAFYGSLGSYQITDFLTYARTLPPAMLGVLAFGFLIAAAAKSAQVPFHNWLPDAMEAPTPISALIHAATMVNAGVYLLARFYPAFAPVPGWKDAVVVVGVVSAVSAAFMAIFATDLKRVLAYSTISQLGYMVYAIGAGGVFASQFHLLSHAVFKALLFLGAGAIIHIVGTRDMRQMGGLGRKMPFVRDVFLIGALALAGLPILNGFWSKELVLEAGLDGGPTWAYVFMLICAGLTALYTFRMVWMVFYGERRGEQAVRDAPGAMRISLFVLALGTLTTWLMAGSFGDLLSHSLSFQTLSAGSTQVVALHVLTAWPTWLALAVVALGLAAWWWRDRLAPIVSRLRFLSRVAAADFGFEWLNGVIVRGTRSIAAELAILQTGQLNLNMLGIVGGLVIVLAVLALGSVK